MDDIIKIDLHIHSKASEYKDGKIVCDSDIDHINVLMSKLEENQIQLFAITDHNRFDYALYSSIRATIKQSKYKYIKCNLPAVEFDVQLEEGKPKCHVIAVFDDRDEEKVAQIENNIFKVNKLEKPDEVYSLREFEEILQTIGLKTVLIVHQRQGITNNNPRNQSLSAATDNPFMFLKYGYFDSLEYNHPRVEGIVKSSLRDLNLYYPLITGSDCHQWDAYPYHDMRGGTNRDFTKLKCMPSFMGLVMSVSSFSTRSNRRVSPVHLRQIFLHSNRPQCKSLQLSLCRY